MTTSKHSIDNETAYNELESFYYSISHDLRAPLRSIDGFSLALLEDYGDGLDPTARDYLERIRSSCQLMGRLIDDILCLSRLSRVELHLDNVDLSALAHEVAAELKKVQAECNVIFIIADGIIAYCDKILLKQVLQNLMSNALKSASKQEQPKIEFGMTDTDGDKAYFVRDNSISFDMDSKDTGVGLASVQRIINRHGGRVWVEESPDRGASFCFTLNAEGI